jgi:hypothetical protein
MLMHPAVSPQVYTLCCSDILYVGAMFPLLNTSKLTTQYIEILLRKKNKTAYASALTLLWVLVMLTFSFDWQYHRSAFVIHNDSPLDIAEAVEGRADSLTILDNTLSISCNWLADALVVCPSDDNHISDSHEC